MHSLVSALGAVPHIVGFLLLLVSGFKYADLACLSSSFVRGQRTLTAT
jgi:hypothetical protein